MKVVEKIINIIITKIIKVFSFATLSSTNRIVLQ